MMTDLIQYQQVRVKRLLHDMKVYDVCGVSQRLPDVGDVGTLIEVLHAVGFPDHYIVEKTDSQTGLTIWLAEFERDELEGLE